jgi:hypothetical protein
MSGFKSWLYKNDIVCFVLNGAENADTKQRKTLHVLWPYNQFLTL